MKRLLFVVCCLVIGIGGAEAAPASSAAAPQSVTVFAAASLKNAMDAVATRYEKQHPDIDLKISYAGSSTLARQIEAGAPADIYISANQQWMDKLEKDGLINADSRYDLLGNSLVLIAPKASHQKIKLVKGVDLAKALGANNYLAMANTDAVPAGIYGKNALEYLGAWQALNGHIAQAEDVRAALALVSRGESPLGVVYSSDAVADHGVRVVDTFPKASHEPIVYPAAALAASDNPADADVLSFLKSRAAAKRFERWGFRVVADKP